MDEAARCLGCKKPRCQEGCPIGTNIPEVIRLLKEGKLDEAGWMLFENNPLTTVCSLVCNHESQCEGHCIRGIKEAPVHFSIIENYISTTYANKMVKGPAPSNGRRAAVIGAGPAGLTIAIILARYGYQVTIFDGRDKIGGVMRYGIPDFRLPDAVLDDIAYRHLELKGIKFRPNTYIGNTLTIDDLFRDGYESVFVGAGLWRPNRLNIKGESLGHVSYAINYLANPDAFHLGERVVVIGTGNSAMDCARTAIRKGARHVVCVARGDTIGASQYETSYAKLEGVDFLMNKATLEIRDDGVVLADNQKREDGSTVTVEGTEKLYPCDSVIIAVSQGGGEQPGPDHPGHRHHRKGPAGRGRGRPHQPARCIRRWRRSQRRAHRGGGGGQWQACGRGHARLYAESAHARARPVRGRARGPGRPGTPQLLRDINNLFCC